MHDRKHLERVLKINGVTLDASDEEIRAVLTSARYRNDEVEKAMAVLRQTDTSAGAAGAGARQLLQSDSNLSPQDISKYLGFQVDVSALKANRPTAVKKSQATASEQAMLLIAAISFGILCFIAAMYFMEFGLFHPTAAAIFYGD